MGQTVLVNYTASTLDGHVFDQTAHEPLHVDVGRVMPGWNDGIQKIDVGGKIRLYIPPSLGYGSDAVSGVPADSTLIYDIESWWESLIRHNESLRRSCSRCARASCSRKPGKFGSKTKRCFIFGDGFREISGAAKGDAQAAMSLNIARCDGNGTAVI